MTRGWRSVIKRYHGLYIKENLITFLTKIQTHKLIRKVFTGVTWKDCHGSFSHRLQYNPTFFHSVAIYWPLERMQVYNTSTWTSLFSCESYNIWEDRKTTVTQKNKQTIYYNQGMQKSLSENHTGYLCCQLRTGSRGYGSHRLTNTEQYKTGKTLPGQMSLDLCCNIQMLRS